LFATVDATGKLQAAWRVKEQLHAQLATGYLTHAAAAKERLQVLEGSQPETNRFSRTVCRRWKRLKSSLSPVDNRESGSQQHRVPDKRTGRGFTNARNYTTRILLRSAARTAE
jgi:transposase